MISEEFEIVAYSTLVTPNDVGALPIPESVTLPTLENPLGQ